MLKGVNKELKGEVDKLNDERQRQHYCVSSYVNQLSELTQVIREQAKKYDSLNQLTKAIKDEAEKLKPEKAQQEISLPNAGYAPVCDTGNSQTSEQSMELLEVLNVKYGIVHSNLQVCYDKLNSAYHHESKLLFGFVTRKAVSYIEDGVAFAAFGTDAYLMSLGEGHHYKKKRSIANVIGFILAILSTLSTSLAILVEAKLYDVEWNQRWFYKGEKPYIPLFAIGDLIVTLGSVFLFGNTIPLWTIQLKASVYDFCSGIGTMCFFYKFLKAIKARVLRRWWWTGAD
ncbi:unnamed protein product [Coffea canephora]|uniref:Uncharacterized protein n=1 Tax=Coffea canephora TaxID=49390 RepID=A0A068U6J6_COFCA|nr:unnamed protein product [Coffea canephora]